MHDSQKKTVETYLSVRNVFVSALTGAGKSSTFELARILRTTVSFLSAQFRHKMFVKSEPSPSFRQFSCKIFLRNHFFFKFALSIDAGETHTHPIILVDRREPILSAIQGVPNAI